MKPHHGFDFRPEPERFRFQIRTPVGSSRYTGLMPTYSAEQPVVFKLVESAYAGADFSGAHMASSWSENDCTTN